MEAIQQSPITLKLIFQKNGRKRQIDFLGKDPLLCNICQTDMVFVSAHVPSPLTLVKGAGNK